MTERPSFRERLKWIGLVGGPVGAVVLYAVLPDTELVRQTKGSTVAIVFGPAGRATLGLMFWMATWWLTEAIDVAVTALLPLAALPLLTVDTYMGLGVSTVSAAGKAMTAAATPYANPFIALFMGGFILALAMERWGLHRRIALTTLRFVGTRPMSMVAGFMAITAVMSMWVSNTATTVMMLPLALSVTGLFLDRASDGPGRRHFGLCLMLGIAYAASIGGIGTLIGTPPNVAFAAYLQREHGVTIAFVRWLGVGLPLVAVFVPIVWLLLTRVLYPLSREPIPGGRELIRNELATLGPMKPGEWVTLVVFMIAAGAWITRPYLVQLELAGLRPLAGLTDPGIAMIAALLLFAIPVSIRDGTFVMNWAWARKLPWGILVLFGGGLSLAAAVRTHGVAEFIGAQAGALGALPSLLIVVAIVTGVIFLTELTSNTATIVTLLPILDGLAPSLGLPPLLLMVPAVIAASCAFMMPVATPPNAIVFGSGHVTIPEMCRAGVWLNLLGIVLVTGLTYLIAVPLLRIG